MRSLSCTGLRVIPEHSLAHVRLAGWSHHWSAPGSQLLSALLGLGGDEGPAASCTKPLLIGDMLIIGQSPLSPASLVLLAFPRLALVPLMLLGCCWCPPTPLPRWAGGTGQLALALPRRKLPVLGCLATRATGYRGDW